MPTAGPIDEDELEEELAALALPSVPSTPSKTSMASSTVASPQATMEEAATGSASDSGLSTALQSLMVGGRSREEGRAGPADRKAIPA